MARRSFVKELQVKVDSKEVDILQKKLDNIYVDTIKSAINDFEGTSEEDIQRLKSLKAMLDELTDTTQTRQSASWANIVKSQMSHFGKDLTNMMKDFFADVFESAKERVMDMASYDLGSSMFSNQAARQQALQYGIVDPSQNYALSQSMQELGMAGEEDLMYMNENQQEKFAERMGYWTTKYSELADKDFFNTVENFAIEFEEFRAEMEMGMVEFFVQNKDTIMTVMKAAMSFMENVILLLGGLLELFQIDRSASQKQAASMEIIRTYGANTRNTNVNISNTMHPSSQVLTDKQMLAQAGSASYAQVIEALKG